jgi:hypothetical protein
MGVRLLARGYKTGILCLTTNTRYTVAVAVVVAVVKGDSKPWHLRLGYMSEKGMKVLLSKGKLLELKSVESDLCEDCILGKQKNVSFMNVGRTLKPDRAGTHGFVGSLPSGIS